MSPEEINRDTEAEQRDKTKAAIKAKIWQHISAKPTPQELLRACPPGGNTLCCNGRIKLGKKD